MRFVLGVFIAWSALMAPAHAYLDGATASIILQAIIGFFAAWGIYSRRAKDYVLGLFGRKEKPSED